MTDSRLELRFDASSWRPDYVAIVADDGASRTIDVTSKDARLPFPDDTFAQIAAANVIRFVPHPLEFMQELHRIAKPDATISFVLEHASSDDAYLPYVWSRPYTPVSFVYFGQPAYYRADYGYRGDWEIADAIYWVRRDRYGELSQQALRLAIERDRNVVAAFSMTLRSHKPIRRAAGPLEFATRIAYV